jgi:protein-L-isoaspartate(D-aspartate) O-methyltransferase
MKLSKLIRFTTVTVILGGFFLLICSPRPRALSQADEKIQSSGSAENSWTRPRFSEFGEERAHMVQTQMVQRSPSIRDSQVLEAMRQVPRHLFVPWSLKLMAHEDHPLPIGHGQTISQPYIVALMTEALQLKPKVRIGDGYFGWPEEGPFDGIIVTCAAGHIPPPLIAQLRQGGRMVIPVGGVYEVQRLMVVTKDKEGRVLTNELLPVRFVPMTGAIQREQ